METNDLPSENLTHGIPPKDKPKVITDPSVTAETDDLKTDEDVASPDVGSEPQEVDTEGNPDDDLNTDNDGIGLNHDEKDDLSLNTNL
ncbi:MAG: hypothetical protein EOO01_01070 [Chitinophagaceae bacterium]|nr:MAG: hypothetical protein EOO01_01070 [Chitinophagaceae bacterium]